MARGAREYSYIAGRPDRPFDRYQIDQRTRRIGQQSQQKSIVLQKALYRDGVVPDSIPARRNNLIGYVQSVLRMDTLVTPQGKWCSVKLPR